MARNPKRGTSLEADRVQQMVSQLPLAAALSNAPVDLPKVKAPGLDGLEVTVPKPEDLTEDDLSERLHLVLRGLAQVRDRAPGDVVAERDEVMVDVLGYARGKLIPFSARADQWLEVAPMRMLPGFTEALVGLKVGESAKVDVTLPANYPVANLQGAKATFLVDVRAARSVKMPDPKKAETLKKLGRGKTVEKLMASLLAELEGELADALWLTAQDLVLDEVAKRSAPEVPAALVDEEIRRRWGQAEGKLLSEKGFDAAEQKEALDGWLTDPSTRAEAERRLKIALALGAVIVAEKLELTPDAMRDIVTRAARTFGLPDDEVKASLAKEKKLGAPMMNVAWHFLAVGHVMNKAKLHFEGAPPAGQP